MLKHVNMHIIIVPRCLVGIGSSRCRVDPISWYFTVNKEEKKGWKSKNGTPKTPIHHIRTGGEQENQRPFPLKAKVTPSKVAKRRFSLGGRWIRGDVQDGGGAWPSLRWAWHFSEWAWLRLWPLVCPSSFPSWATSFSRLFFPDDAFISHFGGRRRSRTICHSKGEET